MRVLVTIMLLVVLAPAAALADSRSVAATPPPQDPTTFDRIDEFLEREMGDAGIPGMAVAVVVGGEVAHVRALGVADAGGRPVTPDTPFLLASVSKAFTAAAIMQLVERGDVDLDAPVQAYIPWFRVADEQLSAQITIRHLLHHTAGFVERRPPNDQDAQALERFVRGLSTMELGSAPGDQHNYTNAAYNVLAYVVETVSGMPYDSYLAENIYRPLGMTHSHALEADALADGASDGFYRWFGVSTSPTRMDAPRAEAASATTWSSANDMARWLVAHLRGGLYGEQRILGDLSVQQMHTPYAVADEFHGYAMGWVVRPLFEAVNVEGARSFPFPALVEHGGTWPTGHAYAAIVPERDWGFVLLTNFYDQTNEARFWAVEQGILRILNGKEPVGPEMSPPALVMYGKQIAMAFLALEIVSLGWALSRVARWRSAVQVVSRRAVAAIVIAPLLLDVAVLWLVLVEAPSVGAPLDQLVRWAPDIAYAVVPAAVLAAVWGPIRTVLSAWLLIRRRRRAAAGYHEGSIGSEPLPAEVPITG